MPSGRNPKPIQEIGIQCVRALDFFVLRQRPAHKKNEVKFSITDALSTDDVIDSLQKLSIGFFSAMAKNGSGDTTNIP